MNLFYKSADIVKSSLQIYLDEGQQFSQACDYVTGFHNAAEHCIFLRQFTLWNIFCALWSTYTTFIISPLTQVGKLNVFLLQCFSLSTIVCRIQFETRDPMTRADVSRRCRVAMDLQLQSGVLANASSYRDLVVRLCTLNLHAGVYELV